MKSRDISSFDATGATSEYISGETPVACPLTSRIDPRTFYILLGVDDLDVRAITIIDGLRIIPC